MLEHKLVVRDFTDAIPTIGGYRFVVRYYDTNGNLLGNGLTQGFSQVVEDNLNFTLRIPINSESIHLGNVIVKIFSDNILSDVFISKLINIDSECPGETTTSGTTNTSTSTTTNNTTLTTLSTTTVTSTITTTSSTSSTTTTIPITTSSTTKTSTSTSTTTVPVTTTIPVTTLTTTSTTSNTTTVNIEPDAVGMFIESQNGKKYTFTNPQRTNLEILPSGNVKINLPSSTLVANTGSNICKPYLLVNEKIPRLAFRNNIFGSSGQAVKTGKTYSFMIAWYNQEIIQTYDDLLNEPKMLAVAHGSDTPENCAGLDYIYVTVESI